MISLTNDESFIVIFDKFTDSLYWCELPNRLSDLFDPSFESKLVEESLSSVFKFKSGFMVNSMVLLHNKQLELLFHGGLDIRSTPILATSQFPLD